MKICVSSLIKIKMDLSIVIPTYNERENVLGLIADVLSVFSREKINGEVIIVDDNSPDETWKLVENLSKKNKFVRLLKRKGKLGLSSAVISGFEISRGNILGVMDADYSHPPEKIAQMYSEIKKGNDLVIGSRYIFGGKIVGWGVGRKILSKGATILSRIFTRVKDPMTGYFLVKKEAIIKRGLNPRGFKILLEILIKGKISRVKEVPIVFVNRVKGKSKANTKEVFSLLGNLLGYLFYQRSTFGQFFRFALVGSLGTLVNLIFLYFFTDILGIYYLVSAVLSFVIALSHNYFFNKVWTFNEPFGKNFTSKYIRFFGVSVFALGINLIFLYLFTDILGIYYLISQALAILFSMIVNFLGNKFWTFKES